jgi:hypothetical protein
MTLLADGVDVPSWGGLILSLLIAGAGGIWFLIKNYKPSPDDGGSALVAELRKQIEDAKDRIRDLENDLDDERRGRAEDNRRNTQDMEVLREQFRILRTEVEVSRIQMEALKKQAGIQ